MTENEYIVQALGRIEERQIKNSEGIAYINATVAGIVKENAGCEIARTKYDLRITELESNRKAERWLMTAAIFIGPCIMPAIHWMKDRRLI